MAAQQKRKLQLELEKMERDKICMLAEMEAVEEEEQREEERRESKISLILRNPMLTVKQIPDTVQETMTL